MVRVVGVQGVAAAGYDHAARAEGSLAPIAVRHHFRGVRRQR
jgi:hypothetical protein